jgi:hypothetical protein
MVSSTARRAASSSFIELYHAIEELTRTSARRDEGCVRHCPIASLAKLGGLGRRSLVGHKRSVGQADRNVLTDRVIMRYEIDAKPFDWSDEITADCPRKQARNLSDQCGARCPDLLKVG